MILVLEATENWILNVLIGHRQWKWTMSHLPMLPVSLIITKKVMGVY